MIFCSSLQKKKLSDIYFIIFSIYLQSIFFISFIVSDCTKNISVFNDKHTHNISALWGIFCIKKLQHPYEKGSGNTAVPIKAYRSLSHAI